MQYIEPDLDWVPVDNQEDIYPEGHVSNNTNYDVDLDSNPEAVEDLWNPDVPDQDEVYDDEEE